MRRLLLVAVAAGLPALAAAQTAPPAGQLRAVDFDAVNGSLIGTAQCSGTSDLEVTWTMQASTTGTVATGRGSVRIFASNKQRSVSGDPRTCWLDSDTTNDETVLTAPVTQFNNISMEQNRQTIPGADLAAMATALGVNCASTTPVAIYLCAIPYQNSTSTTQLNGVANGTFTLDTTPPDAVSNVRVQSADGALVVRFDEASGTNATEFRAEAVRRDGADSVVRSGTGSSSPVRIGGLTNGVEYAVTVIAISASGNESEPFPGSMDPKVYGTPLPSDDFWELYRNSTGASEEGGCGTGAAGALGLVGAAALLRLRRRKP